MSACDPTASVAAAAAGITVQVAQSPPTRERSVPRKRYTSRRLHVTILCVGGVLWLAATGEDTMTIRAGIEALGMVAAVSIGGIAAEDVAARWRGNKLTPDA